MLPNSLRLQDFMKDHFSFHGNFHPQLDRGQSDLICWHLSCPRAVLWVVQLSLKVARNFWQDLKFEKPGPSGSQLISLSSTAQHMTFIWHRQLSKLDLHLCMHGCDLPLKSFCRMAPGIQGM